MNLLLTVPWDHRLGGVSYVTGNLARQLRSRGYGVAMAFPGESTFPEWGTSEWDTPAVRQRLRSPVTDDRPIRSRAAFLLSLPVSLAALVAVVLRHGIDVINVHYPTRANIHHALAARVLGRPLVVSVHGSDLFPDGEEKDEYAPSLVLILDMADLVVCPSNAFRQKFVSTFPDLEGKTECIHNGISLEEFRRLDDEEPPDGPPGGRLLCVAAHVHKKGLDVLLRALAEIRQRGGDVHLTLVGRGALTSELERTAVDLGVEPHVEFRGVLGRTEVIGLMRGADVVVVPSRSEPFGLVAAEAMLAGTPVVSSRVGGLQEIVLHGETGLLVEPDRPDELAEAILELVRDPERAHEMGRAARRRVERHFSARKTGEAYLSELTKLVEG